MDINKKRKEATEVLLKQIALIDKYTDVDNVGYWKERLSKLSDNAFHEFMKQVRDGNACIYIRIPNMEKHPSNNELLDLSKKLGVSNFERIYLYDDITGETYLTPDKHMVIRIPIRRPSQYGEHKLSVPEGDSKTDVFTGQVIHEDRAAGISNPEIQALAAKGLAEINQELVAIRGGNVEAWLGTFKKQLEETGSVTLAEVPKDSKNRTVVVAQILMEGLHLQNNISDGD